MGLNFSTLKSSKSTSNNLATLSILLDSNCTSIIDKKLTNHVVYTQGLFSATQTDEVEALVRAGLRNPVRVTVREKYSKSKVSMVG